MKQSEIQIGGVYLTYIGEELAPVEVISIKTSGNLFSKRTLTRYVVRRVGESKPLPKARSAAALRFLRTGQQFGSDK